jgi:cytochrome P450
MPNRSAFPLGAAVALAELEDDPHPTLARLRAAEPVSWLPVLDGWLVTGYELALQVMRDPATFTVDDPRFSTARVVGPSMLSLDGDAHARHRRPFVAPFRAGAVRERFARAVEEETEQLIDALPASGAAELRRGFAGPLAASIVTQALGLGRGEVASVLAWYDAIVSAVTEITAGHQVPAGGTNAFAALRLGLQEVIGGPDGSSLLAAASADDSLTRDEVISNAAVLLFGGIETTEGMIANAILHLLEDHRRVAAVRHDPDLLDAALEESLRLEPAAAVVDRYATADVELAGARIASGDLVRVSIAGANRDPTVFEEPDRFDPARHRRPARRHIAFAHGPHVCVGVHLARLEARVALSTLLRRLSGLRLDPERPARVRGLVFRKPPTLHVVWVDPESSEEEPI